MPSRTILIVDDDKSLVASLERYLATYGFAISSAGSGEDLRREMKEAKPDLIILDIMLPDVNGLDLAREIRQHSNIPIVMLTGRGEETDRVVGLEVGADDYVAKPFSPRELLARINAILRRASYDTGRLDESVPRPSATMTDDRFGEFSGWRIDLNRRRLVDPTGDEVDLTAGEFSVLLALARQPRRVLTRAQLLDFFGEGEADVFDRSVDTRVSRLRRKIEPDPHNPSFIKTEWGVGYYFAFDVDWTE